MHSTRCTFYFNESTLERVNAWIEVVVLNVLVDPVAEKGDVSVDAGHCVMTANSPSDGTNLDVAVFGCTADRANQR